MSQIINPFGKKITKVETEFLGKMNNLVDNYYRISKEDEEILENLFKKYL